MHIRAPAAVQMFDVQGSLYVQRFPPDRLPPVSLSVFPTLQNTARTIVVYHLHE